MIKRLKEECLDCLTRKYLTNFPENSTEEQKENYMRGIEQEIANATEDLAAPVVVRNINNIHEQIFGNRIDFAHLKPYYNKLMMDLEEKVSKKITEAKNPLKLALQYSLIGNYIDFGALKNIDEALLMDELEKAHKKEINEDIFNAFAEECSRAKRLVFATDNCGEIVMDKLFIKEIKKAFPNINVTVVVKGGNVLNDATLEDAVQVGLDKVTRVIGNGNNIAGTWERELSKEALEEFDNADIILTKGQANYETLRGCGRNIYYLFLCKCDMFARDFKVERFTGMFIKERA